jgi:hypothetical protein
MWIDPSYFQEPTEQLLTLETLLQLHEQVLLHRPTSRYWELCSLGLIATNQKILPRFQEAYCPLGNPKQSFDVLDRCST